MTFRLSRINRRSRFSSQSQNRFKSVAASANTTGVSESAVSEAANAAANTLKKDLPEGIENLDYVGLGTSYSSNATSNSAAVVSGMMSSGNRAGNQESFGPGGTEAAINNAMSGNQVDETKASGGGTKEGGDGWFGLDQDGKDFFYDAWEYGAAAAAIIGGVAGAMGPAGAALAPLYLGIGAGAGTAYLISKHGEWHPDQLTDSGRTGIDPVTGKFDPSKGLGSLPNEIYGGIQASKAGTILMTAQEASLVMKAVEAGSGGHVTNPVGDSASNISALNMMNAEFQLSGGGVVDPHLLSSALSNVEVLA